MDATTNIGCYSPIGKLVYNVTSFDDDVSTGDSTTMALLSTTPSTDFNFATTGLYDKLSHTFIFHTATVPMNMVAFFREDSRSGRG